MAKQLLENLSGYIGMLSQGQNDQIVAALSEVNKEVVKQIRLASIEEDKIEAANQVVEEPTINEPVVVEEVKSETTEDMGAETELLTETEPIETKSALRNFADKIVGKKHKKKK